MAKEITPGAMARSMAVETKKMAAETEVEAKEMEAGTGVEARVVTEVVKS